MSTTDRYQPPPLPVCDFCGEKPVWAFPCEDFDTGVPDMDLSSERRRVTAGSHGAWCACDPCASLIRSADRRALARRTARSIRERRLPDFRGASINLLQRLAEGLHGDFWKHRDGEPRLLTAEELATPPHPPEATPVDVQAPVPQWLIDARRDAAETVDVDPATMDGETRGRAAE